MIANNVLLILTLVIYAIIVFIFNKARIKYAGGKVGSVTQVILVTILMLFVADYAHIFSPYVDKDLLTIIETIFRTAGLGFLAYGGAKIYRS